MSRFFCLSLLLIIQTTQCFAQSAADSTIRLQASAKSDLVASRMRVRVEVYGVGADLNAALASLAQNRSQAQAQIDKFSTKALLARFSEARTIPESPKSELPSLSFVGPTPALPPLEVGTEALDLPPPSPSAAPESRVSSTLNLDLPLSGDNEEEILKSAEQWKLQLAEADLSGIKAMEAERAKTPRKENEPALPCLCGLGDTKTIFVHPLREEDRISLAAKAIAAAKQDAERWAKIADLQVGKIVSLQVDQEAPVEAMSESAIHLTTELRAQVTFEFLRIK